MNHWLIKSEPGEWSWAQHCAAKGRRAAWTGVRNAQAVGFLKQMIKGDRAFFYHTGDERAIVGVVEVVKPAYPDPTDESGKAVIVDVKAIEPMPEPVTLAAIKAAPRLAHIALVKQSRLSVMPIDAEAWQLLCAMGRLK